MPPTNPATATTAAAASSSTATAQAIAHALRTRHALPASARWVASFLSSARTPLPPIPALTSTAHFRLLASDLTRSLAPDDAVFPLDIATPTVKERTLLLPGSPPIPIPVQVLDVLDIGSSAWSQIEALERVERGEQIRGRQVIRTLPPPEEEEGTTAHGAAAHHSHHSHSNTSSSSSTPQRGPLRLILQDARGTRVVALEKRPVAGLLLAMTGDDDHPHHHHDANANANTNTNTNTTHHVSIGMKLLLSRESTLVRRGVVMLTPDNVVVLGGKVDAWDQAWKHSRKQRLLASLDTTAGGGGGGGDSGPVTTTTTTAGNSRPAGNTETGNSVRGRDGEE